MSTEPNVGVGARETVPPRLLTRRALFCGAMGLVTSQAARAGQMVPASQAGAGGNTAYPTPGLLAQSRLTPAVVALMTGATLFSAQRRAELASGLPYHLEKTDPPLMSRRFPLVSPLLGVSTPDQVQMARRLADLLLRDALWSKGVSWESTAFEPDFVFTFADRVPGVVVSVCPKTREIHLDWTDETTHATRTSELLFDPVGKEMTEFIKDAFPFDAAAQALTFMPTPKVPRLVPERPTRVSPALWAKINALKPGMTRADLLQVFHAEGGMSSRLRRSYVLTEGAKPPMFLHITAEFAPADLPLLWRNGKGFLRNIDDIPKAANGRELPDDVITSLSPVYWGYFMFD